ncbi:MAG TPA: hypothetical protein GXX75_09540 [Clostridiales bacterium]|nr:hypothetical protein [Clostridiales bacterium]
MLFKKDKEMIHFSGRRHTKTGIASTAIGGFVILGFLALSISSSTVRGNGGMLLGVLGILLFGLSVFGFYLSYKAFKKKDIFYRYPVIGASLNGVMAILFLVLYILGIIV